MIELSQLKQFIAVAECGTLSSAADKLYLSQPALSRSMQKLERDLNVPLFLRQKSKLLLNENGKLFYDLSCKLLENFDSSIERLRSFDRKKKTIAVGSCAPVPLWEMIPALTTLFPEKTITADVKNSEDLFCDLLNKTATIIVTLRPFEREDVFSFACGTERLMLNVPDTHPLAKNESVTFDSLADYSMLLFSKIGDWRSLVKETLPHTHFIIQDDWDNFLSLARISALPSFTSDIVIKYFGTMPNAKTIPIEEEKAEMKYFCCMLNENKRIFRHFIERFSFPV